MKRPHHWNRWYAQFKRRFGSPGRIWHCLIAVRSDSSTVALQRPILLAVSCMFAVHSTTKGKYWPKEKKKERENRWKNMLPIVHSVQIYRYLLIAVEKAGVVSEAQELGMKNNWEKWVERKKNGCFDNLCQMFSQRPASDLKYYADVGFGFQ